MDESYFRRELARVARDLQVFMHETMGRICKRHDLTMHNLYIMMELNIEPGQTISQLSDRVGILPTNFTPVCRKMEERGLIERQQSEADRRSYTLHLSAEGKALFDTMSHEVERRYGSIFETEPDETFDTILKGFEALHTFVKRFDLA